eukprot:4077001-Pleurochrysis_carterae.AAC.1
MRLRWESKNAAETAFPTNRRLHVFANNNSSWDMAVGTCGMGMMRHLFKTSATLLLIKLS